MTRLIAAIIPLAVLAGCATTAQQTASAEEHARCEQMAERMRTDTTHDHGEMKGNAPTAMNETHKRCSRILGKKAA